MNKIYLKFSLHTPFMLTCLLNQENWQGVFHFIYFNPLARREAPAEGRRSEGEGANIDRRLVPYHGKCKRIQSHIEFIYIYIFIYIINGLLTRGIGKFGPGK